ncbi:hypothetical protein IGI04_011577 [Brassica rapa subsp. trilocularis]|uniref:HMA domain-containing protein n=1 Tax=Brassica rapa subsp. trilocularis TaxID=1813537 RepID=A0ABQ7N3G9_BRACM|nr:hypothetical protein IGI04_011577 [Brassica rapa subsp. trilocularis]
MSKEEFMNIQTCVLKVNIHCEGCKQKVKKILQKIEGVFTTKIDADQGKVTVSVSGSVDPSVLIEKLAKSGKHAEVWGAPKGNNNPNQSHDSHLVNQLKEMQIGNKKGSGGKNNNDDKGPKNVGSGGGGNNPHQIQKMKGFQDMKIPQQLKDLKGSVPESKNQNQPGAKFNVPEEEEDDYFSDDDDEFNDAGDEDSDDDEFDDLPSQSNKMMMPNNQQMMMNANLGGGPTKNGGKGVYGGGKGEPNGGGGGKGDSGGAGNQNQGGGKNGGQNANGGHPQDDKNGGGPNAGKKVNGGGGGLPAGFLPMGGGVPPNMSMPIGVLMGMGDPMGNIPAGLCPMGGAGPSNVTMPIGGLMGMGGLMGNIPAVHGLPATGASGIPPGYFQRAGPNPIQMQHQQQQQQQQYLAAVLNQQRAMENERFQPMMYARPPLAVNYMPPHIHLHQYPNPYDPYPYPPHGNDQYFHVSNEENTSSCDIM